MKLTSLKKKKKKAFSLALLIYIRTTLSKKKERGVGGAVLLLNRNPGVLYFGRHRGWCPAHRICLDLERSFGFGFGFLWVPGIYKFNLKQNRIKEAEHSV